MLLQLPVASSLVCLSSSAKEHVGDWKKAELAKKCPRMAEGHVFKKGPMASETELDSHVSPISSVGSRLLLTIVAR